MIPNLNKELAQAYEVSDIWFKWLDYALRYDIEERERLS